MTTSGQLWWEHSDPRGMRRAVLEAIARAKAGHWSDDVCPESTGDRVADLRALIIGSWAGAEELSAAPTGDGANLSSWPSSPGEFTSPAKARAALAMATTWTALATKAGAPSTVPAPFRTVGGGAPVPLGADAGVIQIGIAAAVTVVAAATAVGVACGWIASGDVAKVVDRFLARDANTRRMVSAQASAVALAQVHAGREALAGGKELPLDAAEIEAFSQLQKAQSAAAGSDPKKDIDTGAGAGGWAAAAALLVALVLITQRS